jgi:hypothetical protein
MNRFYFHSYPRQRTGELRTDQLRKAELISQSILDNGLLLTPENHEYSLRDRDSNIIDQIKVIQRRICFTELEPAALPKHSESFGPFALVYEIEVLRRFGALPVFYVPLVTDGGYLSGLASELLAGLTDASRLVSSLVAIRRHLAGSVRLNLEYRGRSVAFGPDQSDVIRFFIDTLLDSARTDGGATESRLSTTASCFYPTENPKYTEPLHYYRQREWRIVGGFFSFNNVPMSVPATEAQVRQLEAIDLDFFTKRMRFAEPTLGIGAEVEDTMARRSHFFSQLGDLNVVDLAKCLVIPTDFENAQLTEHFTARGIPVLQQDQFIEEYVIDDDA